jgi:hypothetical protein
MRPRTILAALGLGLVLGLGACAADLPVVRGESPGRAQTTFAVRTASTAPSGVVLDVAGVDCVAETAGYRVAFRSPARVGVPDPGPGAPPVIVRCAGGGRSGEALLRARPVTGFDGVWAYPSIGIGVSSSGDVGVGIGAGLSPVATRPSRAGYPDVRVVLR